jgi:pyridoxamine 5'-phosphate oxidase
MSLDLKDKRKTYDQSALLENQIPLNPFELFKQWYHDATQSTIIEPQAMVLATADESGQPAARIVLLKEVTDKGFVFYTNYESNKGADIKVNPQVQLLFYWDVLERQVRIKGKVKKIPASASDAYFYSRPLASQYGAMVSHQSESILSREYLEEQLASIQQSPAKRPAHWGGYAVIPTSFEYWQGRPSRLHDRIVYTSINKGKWGVSRLSP